MLERIRRLLGSKDQSPPALPPQAPFEYLTVRGEDVAEEMRRAESRSGIVPVFMGNRNAFERAVEIIDLNAVESDAIQRAGLELNVDEWIKGRVAEEPEDYEVEETETGTPDTVPAFSPARDILSGEFEREVFIGLIPVETPWLVPAYLKPGGWNECPEPHVHLAFFRRWHERYGARVITVTNDIIEFAVARPPSTHAEASTLAWEQFVYCTDIVHQGVETLGNLRASLINSPNWYFWWD
ncbi:MAG TPA: DUF4253 domain-containing protein [Pyrinomonadaceae bacterium]|jgi:hypothetical protein|nr:DUF4253 domain-containing protein [Pyrinomonadaceae bacterium]